MNHHRWCDISVQPISLPFFPLQFDGIFAFLYFWNEFYIKIIKSIHFIRIIAKHLRLHRTTIHTNTKKTDFNNDDYFVIDGLWHEQFSLLRHLTFGRQQKLNCSLISLFGWFDSEKNSLLFSFESFCYSICYRFDGHWMCFIPVLSTCANTSQNITNCEQVDKWMKKILSSLLCLLQNVIINWIVFFSLLVVFSVVVNFHLHRKIMIHTLNL